MEAFFWVVVALALVAGFGHGCWVVVSWSIRGLWQLSGFGGSRPVEAEMCPDCGEPWVRRARFRHCPACGWSRAGGPAPRATDRGPFLEQLRRRLDWYRHLGLLSEGLHARLVAPLEAEAPAPSPVPSPEPVATPESPVLEIPEPSVLDVAARVRAYRAAREEAPVEAPAPTPTPTPAEPGPRRLGRLLAAFLEESNIRWGELVGGLLIVGCSLALVLGYWSSIAGQPLLKYGLFNGVAALAFALGHHAERRWRLPSTALGLLAIAAMLTPLNFLAIASMGQGGPSWLAAGEVASAALFAGLAYRAGLSLAPGAPWTLALGVMGPSAAILLIRRFVEPGEGEATLLALGALAPLAQLAAVGGLAARARRRGEVDGPSAVELLRLLGLTSFATAMALGLLLSRLGPFGTALHRAAALAPLAGAPAMVAGLLLWRRLAEVAPAGYCAAGTAVAAAGSLLMLSGVALAWPDPAGMVPVALLNFAALSAVALGLEVAAAHVPAAACLGLAYLLGCHLAAGGLGWSEASGGPTAAALLSAGSGSALVPMAAAYALAAAFALGRGRRPEAQALAASAGMASVLAVGLVSAYGFGLPGDPAGATWAYAAMAAVALTSAAWFGRRPLVEGTTGAAEATALGLAGSGLLFAGLAQALVFRGIVPGLALPWAAALLGHATLAGLLGTIGRGTGRLGTVLARSAVATSIASAAVILAGAPSAPESAVAWRLAWLAGVWVGLAWARRSPALFAAGQAAASLAAGFGVAARWGWSDVPAVQAHALAQAVLCLAWIAARLGARSIRAGRAETAHTLLEPGRPAFDRYLRGAVLLALVALAAYGAGPGVARELTPRGLAAQLSGLPDPGAGRVVPPASAFEVAGLPHAPALEVGSWAVLAVVLAVLLAGQWERFRRLDLLGALVAGWTAAPLLAGRWEVDLAAASALRWAGGVACLAGSALIWERRRLADLAGRLGWRFEPGQGDRLAREATAMVIGLAVLPSLAMAAFVGASAVLARPIPPAPAELWAQVAVLFAVLGAAGAVLRLAPFGRRPWPPWTRTAATLLWLLGALPLVAVTVYVVGQALAGDPIAGPEPGSAFHRLGLAGSYVPPIVLLAGMLLGFAVRERSSGFALAAGLVLNVAATAGYLLAGAKGAAFDALLWTRLAQLNAGVAGGFALAWVGAASGRGGRGEDGPRGVLVSLAVALNLLVLAGGIAAIAHDPAPGPMHRAIADASGWAAFLLAAGAVLGQSRAAGRRVGPDWLGLGAVAGAAFLAIGTAPRDSGDWLTHHALVAGQALAAVALPLAAWRAAGLRLEAVPRAVRAAVVRWATLAATLAVVLAQWSYWDDPGSTWWTTGTLVAMAPVAAVLSVWSGRAGYLALGGMLLNLAANDGWFAERRPAGPGWSALGDFGLVNALTLALPAPAWLWVDRVRLRAADASERRPWAWWAGGMPFGRWAAWAALVLLAVVTAAGWPRTRPAARPGCTPGWGGWPSGRRRSRWPPGSGTPAPGAPWPGSTCWAWSGRAGPCTSFTSRRAGWPGPDRCSWRPGRWRRATSGAAEPASRAWPNGSASPGPGPTTRSPAWPGWCPRTWPWPPW